MIIKMLNLLSNTSRVLNLAKCLSAHLFIRQSSPPRLAMASSGRSSEFKISVESGVLTREQVWRIKQFGPIRGQYSGHVICLDQSEASIQVTLYVWTNQRPVLPAGVLQGAVMRLPLVRVVGSVKTMGVPEA